MEKKDRKMFPLYVDLSDKTIVVAGGGFIAERRITSLLDFAGKIIVTAPEVTPVLEELHREGRIVLQKREFNVKDIDGADIVLAATSDSDLNEDIYRICKARNITVNISDNQEKCDFFFPGIIRYGDIVIGFSSGGSDHRKTKEVRQKVEAFLKNEDTSGGTF